MKRVRKSEEEKERKTEELSIPSHTLIMNVFSLYENDAFVKELII